MLINYIFLHKLKKYHHKGSGDLRYEIINQKILKTRKRLSNQIIKLVHNNWGALPNSFIIARIFQSDKIIVIYKNDEVIGFSQYNFYYDKLFKKYYCSIGISIISKRWRGLGLNVLMLARLLFNAFIKNIILNKKFNMEVIFTTSNIRFVSLIKEISTKVYPDPDNFNLKFKKIQLADSETWYRVRHYLARTGERIFRLQREGCVITKSFDDMPYLIDVIKITHSKKEYSFKEEAFIKKYLKIEQLFGNEIVVRAVSNFFLFLKYIFKKILFSKSYNSE